MKTYKYSTKERAERVAKTLGCTGSHQHTEKGNKIFMPCKSHEIFTKKTKNSEGEVTELVDDDGTWNSSSIPILNPATTGTKNNPTTTDKIVSMSKNPRDPLLRGWYGYYGEGHVKEIDMSKAFGFEDTKFMDAEETEKFFKKELKLKPQNAKVRTLDQGKKKGLDKKTPPQIKKKKGFIDREILKELELDEEMLLDKSRKSDDGVIGDLIKKNVRALKKMANDNNISLQELIYMLKDE
jgi:hypothetical protein